MEQNVNTFQCHFGLVQLLLPVVGVDYSVEDESFQTINSIGTDNMVKKQHGQYGMWHAQYWVTRASCCSSFNGAQKNYTWSTTGQNRP